MKKLRKQKEEPISVRLRVDILYVFDKYYKVIGKVDLTMETISGSFFRKFKRTR